jgi:hypothetical protein
VVSAADSRPSSTGRRPGSRLTEDPARPPDGSGTGRPTGGWSAPSRAAPARATSPARPPPGQRALGITTALVQQFKEANLHMPSTGFVERALRLLEKTRFIGNADEDAAP